MSGAEHPELRDVRITFVGEANLTLAKCAPALVEVIVDHLTKIMRGHNSDPVYTINRPLLGFQIFDATKIVSIEILGGPGIGRWADGMVAYDSDSDGAAR